MNDTPTYETIGVIDRAAADAAPVGGEAILVDNGDDELLIAQPRSSGGEDDD